MNIEQHTNSKRTEFHQYIQMKRHLLLVVCTILYPFVSILIECNFICCCSNGFQSADTNSNILTMHQHIHQHSHIQHPHPHPHMLSPQSQALPNPHNIQHNGANHMYAYNWQNQTSQVCSAAWLIFIYWTLIDLLLLFVFSLFCQIFRILAVSCKDAAKSQSMFIATKINVFITSNATYFGSW